MTLATAMMRVAKAFPTVFYAPRRWGTADGCMPYQAMWASLPYAAAEMALERVSIARAVNVGMGAEAGPGMVADDLREAHPR